MQGNKKHTEGHSDSSSIGSLLDDTDREVCSLTDRAFKSLCVAELDASYNESSLITSPGITNQFSSKFHQATLNHAIKKSNLCSKLTSKDNEHAIWASTFQQLPKCIQEEKKVAKNSTPSMARKNLNLQASGLRNNKPVSKVSSLIKTFDKAENRGAESSLLAVRQPVKNLSQKCKVNQGNDLAVWGDKTVLNFQKGLSEFSGARQENHWLSGKHELQKMHNKMDLDLGDPDGYHPSLMEASHRSKLNLSSSSRRTVKNRSVKATESAKKGNFLHSENSAFESWKAHHKKLAEKEEIADIIAKREGLRHIEEIPLIKGSPAPEHNLLPSKDRIVRIQEEDFLMDLSPPATEFTVSVSPVSLHQGNVPSLPVPQAPVPLEADFQVPVKTAPVPKVLVSSAPVSQAPPLPASMSQAPTPPPSVSQALPLPMSQAHTSPSSAPQVTFIQEKANPELDICPPWRKKRATKGAVEKKQILNERLKPNNEESSLHKKPGTAMADTKAEEKQVNSSDSINPSFDITKLLTPIIPSKQETEALENQPMFTTPLITDFAAAREQEGTGFNDYRSRDNYKSKASSLLFNLKDVRKRVKSTYSPSPLLRALEEKNKTKENIKQKIVKMNAELSPLIEESNKKVSEKDDLSCRLPVPSNTSYEKHNKINLNEHFTDNYLTLSSPEAIADLLLHQKEDSFQQDDSKSKDLVKETENNENVPMLGHLPNGPGLGERPCNSLLKPNSRDNIDSKVAPQIQIQSPSLPGLQSEKESENKNVTFDSKIAPNLLSPTEDVPYSDNQTSTAATSNENKDKTSTSSSEQSFVSTVEQPVQEESFSLIQLFRKACFQESQRNMSETNATDEQIKKEKEKVVGKDELQYYAFINSDVSAEERSEGKAACNESESMMKEGSMREKREEASGMDSVLESKKDTSSPKSDESLTPPASNQTKPNLFLIKDNTFKSSPVIKAVKPPLLRSLSLEDTVSSSYKEMENRFAQGDNEKHGKDALRFHEVDWPLSRNTRHQNTRKTAISRNRSASEFRSLSADTGFQGEDDAKLLQQPSLSEDVDSFSLREWKEEDENTSMPHALLNKVGKIHKGNIQRDKEKPKMGKKKQSLAQSELGDSQAQYRPGSPSEEKTRYFKNHLLSDRRGGSCAKQIITRESSPTSNSILEVHTCSPVHSETLRDIIHLEGTPVLLDDFASSVVTSPKSDKAMYSVSSTPSEKPASSSVRSTEDTQSRICNVVTKHKDEISAEEILASTKRSLLSEDPNYCTATNERSRFMGCMEKTAGKPPAVPPKTEKALRRAKKLASRRKKIEDQQKKLHTEHMDSLVREPSHSGQISLSPLPMIGSLPSPVPRPTFTASGSSTTRFRGAPSVSPTPSLPTPQRKFLQDPESGQYYVFDLPPELRLKTFYDPETGNYIQVSIPASERNFCQTPSSEMLNSSHELCPRVLPLQVSSVVALRSPSQLSAPAWLMQEEPRAPAEPTEDWQQDCQYAESLENQPYIEPVSESHSHDTDETQISLERDMNRTTNMEIISINELDDFAVEEIS
ncbi:cardiac-enriched FHL2-interacting protein [Alligator mississippiensis]|uniref:cardiac-enriched FHL2-interacting protein n=1 Tax=Alligator mississippiensis TaxID=8496 RepID=UPI0003D099B7|nr:cardiac-enriched FHL2-interacting protein [Alligator mississippiensis]